MKIIQSPLEEASMPLKEVHNIAMVIVLISFSMLFATLFLSYALYRVSAIEWPPNGGFSINLFLPTVNTIVIIMSSWSYYLYQKSYQKAYHLKSFSKLIIYWTLSTALGLLFIGLQFALWQNLKSLGIYSGSNILSSIIYSFTWIHCAHMILGIAALLFLLPTLKAHNQNYSSRVNNIGKCWHFLAIIWFIMYLTLFIF